jgi:hypothetical protein
MKMWKFKGVLIVFFGLLVFVGLTVLYAEPVFQEATGELTAIDLQAGTFTIKENPLPGEQGNDELSYFVFEPKSLVVMKYPSMQPIELFIKPGAQLKVKFVVKAGKRYADSITVLQDAPETTSTITTTTTTKTLTP